MNLMKQTGVVIGFVFMAAVGVQLAWADEKHHEHGTEQSFFGETGMKNKVVRTVDVTMGDNMRFVPDAITINEGETIRIHMTNQGGVDHEFVMNTADKMGEHAKLMRKFPNMEHGVVPNAIRLKAGQSGDILWKFTKAGKFVYACLIPGHFEAGMQGTITVISKGAAISNPQMRAKIAAKE